MIPCIADKILLSFYTKVASAVLADRVYANYTTSQYRNQSFCLEQNSPTRLWDEQQQG